MDSKVNTTAEGILVIEDTRVHHYGWNKLHWDEDDDLIFQSMAMCSLVPHKTIPAHWHLKFIWRDDLTPEFFNIFNAKENARRIVLHRLNHDTWRQAYGASLERLNDQ